MVAGRIGLGFDSSTRSLSVGGTKRPVGFAVAAPGARTSEAAGFVFGGGAAGGSGTFAAAAGGASDGASPVAGFAASGSAAMRGAGGSSTGSGALSPSSLSPRTRGRGRAVDGVAGCASTTGSGGAGSDVWVSSTAPAAWSVSASVSSAASASAACLAALAAFTSRGGPSLGFAASGSGLACFEARAFSSGVRFGAAPKSSPRGRSI